MVKNQKGISLVELIISASMMALVVLVSGQFLSLGFKKLSKFSNAVDSRSSLASLSGHLQKYMATGDVRFFGFTNQVEDPLARLLVPQPGLCGDLISSCPQDTSFLYIHYDKSTLPAVSAICILETQVGAGGVRTATFVIDGSNSTYGPIALPPNAAEGFTVTSQVGSNLPSGLVPVKTNKMLALLDPPNATVWVSTGSLTKLETTWNPITQTFNPNLSSCIPYLQPQPSSVPPYKVNQLYTVSLKPYGMNQFTGQNQSNITDGVIRNSVGKFPLRMFEVIPRSFGKYPPLNAPDGFAEIRNCAYSNDRMECQGSGLPKIDSVRRLRVDYSFHLSLRNTLNTGLGASRPLRYELRLPTSMEASESCLLNECAFLPVSNSKAIPYRLELSGGLKEDFTNLSDSGFSWIKNLSLSQLRFRLRDEKKEEYFEISFR